jgi:3-hydroxybutyryl-CoA dehydrogenase
MEIRKVGVVGCGLMGSGIAQVAAQSGHPTVVREVSQELVDKGLGSIDRFLAKAVEKGKATAEQRAGTLANLKGTTKLEDLAGCDVIIEAIVENLETKNETFAALDRICGPQTIFASNTSSLSITEMMRATGRHDRFIGLHFFNPVPLMKLVEVVRTVATDPAVIDTGMAFATRLGKTPILAHDASGFIVNRLLVPFILDAIRALEEGVGSIQDIDAGMKLGCNHPMGPLTLLDFVGLDTTYYIANIMFDEFRERRFAPPPLLKRMVQAGWLGKKSGKGFYDWSKEPPVPNNALVGR